MPHNLRAVYINYRGVGYPESHIGGAILAHWALRRPLGRITLVASAVGRLPLFRHMTQGDQ
jgi:hypothetical protein